MNERWSKHGADQDVLNRIVAVRPTITLLEHRYNGWKNGQPGTTEREAGIYACEAYSTPTPNDGYVGHLRPEIVPYADRLGAHLGCAEYDYRHAEMFWDHLGDMEINDRIDECEKEAGI